MIDDVRHLTEKYYSKIVEIRRTLHMIPELGDCEVKTKEYIKKHIEGLSHFKLIEVLDTGIIAIIRNNNNKTIALRADMDGLPIEEINEIPYKSKNIGLMHACGHDAHMAILLGISYILNDMWDKLNVDVKLIFQPAEETTGGAKRIIESGILNDVSRVFGLHVDPKMQVGEVLYSDGIMYSSSTAFDIDIYGDSIHIAESTNKINALEITMILVNELFTLSKTYSDHVLIGIGKIIGGTARNILPNVIHLEASLRVNKEGLYDEVKSLIFKKINEIEEKYNTKITYNEISNYPILVNNKELEKDFLDVCNNLHIKTVKLKKTLLTAEDFAWFNYYIPSYFYNIGSSNKDIKTSLHKNNFNIDEMVLYYGVMLQTLLVFKSGGDNYVENN